MSISQQPKRLRPPTRFEILPADVRVVRDYGPQPQPVHLQECKRGTVQMFSPKSASRLTEMARNARPGLISQFCLTYHQSNPDGATSKKHLNTWLVALRRAAPGVGYLWILEFQTRGVPHFHVWLTAPFSESLWKSLGAAWNRIAEPDSLEHLWWHTGPRLNPHTHKLERSFMAWEMKGAGYLRKYMSKAAQKCVPDGFGWCGRFWGATRDLVPLHITVEGSDLPSGVSIESLNRILCKSTEARRRRGAAIARKIAADRGLEYHRVKLRRTARATDTSGRLNNATPVLLALLERLEPL